MPNLELLSSYLPHPLAASLLHAPHRPLIGQSERFDATVLFADVSGFTPLTEALGQIGTQGSEELTQMLNGYFTPLIEQVRTWGGIVGKFAGDAMTILFSGGQAPQRALAAAQAMRRQMARSAHVETRAGAFILRMKLGLAAGQVLQTVVGNAQRAEFVFAGQPLDAAADAEHQAQAGEIVLHPSLLSSLPPDQADLQPLDGGYARLDRLRVEVPPRPFPALPDSPDPTQAALALRPFLPPYVYDILTTGQTAFVNQHRRVSVLFLSFEGLDYARPQAAEQLGRYVAHLIEVVDRFGGYLARIDMGDKGSKAILLFGAPAAHENDEERALLCALALQSLKPDSIKAQRIGLNSGWLFAGNVGSSLRQEYTVMGEAVNLAARLMQTAEPGQILVGQSTREAIADAFLWQPLPPLKVKGKATPLNVSHLTGRATARPLRLQEPHYALPMVGRSEEMGRIEELLKQVKERHQGHTVGLVAEAGMGKSRLAAQVIGKALEMGYVGYGGEGLSHGTTTPYLAWRPLLRGLLDLNEDQPRPAQIEAARQALTAIHPDLALRLPLLGDALGLDITDNETTAHFDAKLRRQSLFALVADLIHHRAALSPLLLVLEDAHWLDDLSRELTQYVAQQGSDSQTGHPVLLLTVYRPPEIEGRLPLWETPPDGFSEIRLAPFSSQESAELIRLKLAGQTLPPGLVAQIEQQAQGNPFFVDEFVNLIQSQEIDLEDREALARLSVPDSLHALIVSRLDQLAESAKMTIRVASVIGRLFRARWLLAIYPGSIQEELLRRDLTRLSTLELTPLDRPDPELEYLFKHAITQEVAYNTLSFATRRLLHGRVAKHIENAYADDLGAWYAISAYHYRRAEHPAKEFEYTRLAAGQSAGQSSYRQAAQFYERAIQLLQAHDLGTDQVAFDLYKGCFEQYGVLGEYERARGCVEALAALFDRVDPSSQVEIRIAQGLTASRAEQPDQATQHYQEAISLARQHNDRAGLAKARLHWGYVYFGVGEYEKGKAVLDQVIQEAGEEGWRLEASAHQVMGWIVYDEGRYDQTERHWLRSIKLYREHGHQSGEALLLTNLGALYDTIGYVEKGIDYERQGLALARRLGYKVGEEEAERILADVLLFAGQFEEAWEHFEAAISIAQQLHHSYTPGYAYTRMAEILLETTDDLDRAESLCRRAVDLLRGKEALGYPWHTLGRTLIRQGRFREAREALEESLRLRREIKQIDTIASTLADLGQLHLSQGDTKAALNCADEMLGLLFPGQSEGLERPEACLACYHILRADGQLERANQVLRHGYEMIGRRAERIRSEEMRHTFLKRVRVPRELSELWEQVRGSSA